VVAAQGSGCEPFCKTIKNYFTGRKLFLKVENLYLILYKQAGAPWGRIGNQVKFLSGPATVTGKCLPSSHCTDLIICQEPYGKAVECVARKPGDLPAWGSPFRKRGILWMMEKSTALPVVDFLMFKGEVKFKMELLTKTLQSIENPDKGAMEAARERLNNLIKPPGSLGMLEELAEKMAGITGNTRPQIGERSVIVMAGDHGVVEEGVSVAPQEITRQMLPNFIRGIAGIGVLARQAGARLVVVDVGVAGGPVETPGVISRKVRPGTANIAKGPAMTREEAVQAIEVGIEMVNEEINRGTTIVATGDMGIGNTTPSSAILAAFGHYTAEEVTGRGTLVNDEVMAKKSKAIAQALVINQPDPSDGLDVLFKVGGLEIAGLTGVILGAAAGRIPVIIDGFISTAAAMVAAAIEPKCKEYMIAAHLSAEAGHKLMLEHLGLRPMLYMDMRLGEGTGAVLGMHLVDAGCRILNEMATFAEANVMDLEEDKILK